MGLRPGRIKEFFSGTEAGSVLLKERQRWLASNPAEYCQLEPEGMALLQELERLAAGWAIVPSSRAASEPARLAALGGALEPDFLLLRRSTGGPSQLVGGVVCFPSSWSLQEKMGRPLSDIHGVVPGLNAKLGPRIDRFLERLGNNVAWERANWGLSGDEELNHHPARHLDNLDARATLRTTWLRIEHQILYGMPETSGILFGIRLSLHRLDTLAAHPGALKKLGAALATMPEEVAAYKGLATSRNALMPLLLGGQGC